MKTAIALVVFLFLYSLGVSATIYVPDQYATIQAAINASANGDTIIVRPGTYVENIDFLGKAITVASEYGPKVTMIDGGQPPNPDFGSVVTFRGGEAFDTILDGFTITNGTGTTDHGIYKMGGGGFSVTPHRAPLSKTTSSGITRGPSAAGSGATIGHPLKSCATRLWRTGATMALG